MPTIRQHSCGKARRQAGSGTKQFKFTEGPAVDKAGNIFFTDQPNDKIWEYDTDGKLSVFMDKAGRSNGLYVDSKDRIISCADYNNELWAISMNGKVDNLLKDFKGRKLNGPNDLWLKKTAVFIYRPILPA